MRYRGVLATVPGRVTVPVRVPDDLLAEADRLAAELGTDRAIVLGDLVASVLPDALAEAARELLAAHLSPDAATPPALADGATSTCFPSAVAPTIPGAGRSDATDGSGGVIV